MRERQQTNITLRMADNFDYEIVLTSCDEAMANRLLTGEIVAVEVKVTNFVESVETARFEKRSHTLRKEEP